MEIYINLYLNSISIKTEKRTYSKLLCRTTYYVTKYKPLMYPTVLINEISIFVLFVST